MIMIVRLYFNSCLGFGKQRSRKDQFTRIVGMFMSDKVDVGQANLVAAASAKSLSGFNGIVLQLLLLHFCVLKTYVRYKNRRK